MTGRVKALMAAFSTAATLSACTVGPDHVPPLVPSGVQGPFLGATGAGVDPAGPVPPEWWRLYDDPVLDGLVDDALAANTDIRAAAARLREARASLREAEIEHVPRDRVGASLEHGRGPGLPESQTEYGAHLSIGYELDLFGRIGRNVQAARGDLEARQADLEAVRIAIVAETVRAYADAAGAAERQASAQRIVQLLDRSLHLTRRRVEIGETARIDTARIAALRNQRAARIPDIASERDAALYRLAMLTGRTPAELPAMALARLSSLRLEAPIPVGDGVQLLARRPDIKAAERRLAAATARIGVATADLYPRISLGASLNATGNGATGLFGNPLAWLLGPLISWSFHDHARARTRIAGAEATAALSLAEFDGAILRALQETEAALSAYSNALRRREALGTALGEAEVAARIVRAQQREGQVDSLELLDAERTYADAQAELIDMNVRVADAQIDLFRALGGGWSQPPA